MMDVPWSGTSMVSVRPCGMSRVTLYALTWSLAALRFDVRCAKVRRAERPLATEMDAHTEEAIWQITFEREREGCEVFF